MHFVDVSLRMEIIGLIKPPTEFFREQLADCRFSSAGDAKDDHDHVSPPVENNLSRGSLHSSNTTINNLVDFVLCREIRIDRKNDLAKCTSHSHVAWISNRAGHALQLAHLRRLFCSRRHCLLEHTFLERAEKSPRQRELYFLRRVEPAVRRIAFFHHGDGFLARKTDRES